MTLIVGARCTNGIVMGADSAATFDASGEPTAMEKTRKLAVIDGKVIVGVSGFVGLSQRIIAELKEMWERGEFKNKEAARAMPLLSEAFRKHVLPEMKAAKAAQDLIGSRAQIYALCNTLVGIPLSKEPCLISFNEQCAAEEIKHELPFVAVGSAQRIADPFLVFLRHIFWKDTKPNIADGIFTVYWTLLHAIETSPAFVAGPIQVVVLETREKDCVARELAEEEMQEHDQAIAAAEKSLREFRESLKDKGPSAVESLPSPPTPPAEGSAPRSGTKWSDFKSP